MGDVADMIADGTLCQSCLCPFDNGKASGFPRECNECKELIWPSVHARADREKKHQCHCGKKFRTKQGLSHHQRDVHSEGVK